jgi:hypothetical protein
MRVLLAALIGVVLSSGAVEAQQPQPTGLDRANVQFAELWSRDGLPLVTDKIQQQLQTFVGTTHGSSNATVVIQSATGALTISTPLGFQQMDDRGVNLRLPVQGTWQIGVTTEVEARVRFPFFRWTTRVRLTAEIKDLWADMQIDFDASDPVRPVIAHMHRPRIDFRVRLRTSKWYLNVVLWFLRGRLNSLAHQAVADAIATVDPTLARLTGQPDYTLATGGPGIATTAPGLPLERAADKINENLVRYHLPFGSIASLDFDPPYSGTWEDSLTDPTFTQGTPTGRQGGLGDSACWSGHYLASCAFRFAVTGDPGAQRDAEGIVDAAHTMLTMRGVPGLLNRGVWPVAPGRSGDYTQVHQGVDYVMWDFISRDQYMGLFFGLSAAYDLIPDPAFRAKVQVDIELALDYIISNGWTARRRNGEPSVTWTTNYSQILAWLHVGNRVNPQKYGALLAAEYGLADIVWVGNLFSMFDPLAKYYKFNLAHGTFYTLLRLETDPTRWFKSMRGLRVLRSGIGHHQNAHFDMCTAGSDPSLAPAMRQDMQSMLALWLKRPRRYLSWDLTNDPSVDKVNYTPPLAAGATSLSGPTTTQLIAKYPLPIPKRHATDFTWQREPIKLTSHGNGREEEPGIDFLLPYWMARYFNALP